MVPSGFLFGENYGALLRSAEPLQQLLHDEAGRDDHVATVERLLEQRDER